MGLGQVTFYPFQRTVVAKRLLPVLCLAGIACFLTEPENGAPALRITSPTNGEVFALGDEIEIVAEASDSDGTVQSVTFYVNDDHIGEFNSPPYTTTWSAADSDGLTLRIRAIATDDAGARGESSIRARSEWVYETPERTGDGWETASLESVGLRADPLERLVNRLRGQQNHMIHGIVVIRHGLLVFERYFDGLSHPTWGETPVSFDRETPHVLSSVTKSFTAALLGIAIDRGFISDEQEHVLDYYPDLSTLGTGGKEDITLEHLVTMSAGLEWNESSRTLGQLSNDLTRLITVAMNSDDDLVEFVLNKELVAEPGTEFLYSGGLTNVLGNIVQLASGQRLDLFANEVLFDPLGITDVWWWLMRPDFVYASGDIALRPRDMAKFGQLFLQNGRWNGEQVVSEEWVTHSATPKFLFTPPHWAITYGHRGYSYGWWPSVESYGEGAYAASGWGGQTIVVLPEHDMVVALTGGYYRDEPYMTYDDIVVDYVLQAVQ